MTMGAINENEMMYMLMQNDDLAMQVFLWGLRPVFINLWVKIHVPFDSFSQQDACQLGAVGMFKGIRAYREDMPMSFRNFAVLCASREMKASWRKALRQNRLNAQVNLSLDYLDEPDGQYFSEYVTDPLKDGDPARYLAGQFARERVNQCLCDGPDLDRQVLTYRLQGYSYKEIAARLNCRTKDVDNSLQRIRHKISVLFD